MGRGHRDGRSGKRRSYTAGSYGCSRRVVEAEGGVCYLQWCDPVTGNDRSRSLGRVDWSTAIQHAEEQVARLRLGLDEMRASKPTVRRVTRLYRHFRTPDKTPAVQVEDDRQIEMWSRVLGPDFDLSKLSRREWDTFIRLRRTGAIGPRGNQDEKKRKPVGDRTIERDLCFLRALCCWACDFRDDAGHLLLERDPTRGLEIPRERNPAREVATHDRVDSIRAVYRQVKMRVQRGFQRVSVESYLPELFEIGVGTGRRIAAIYSLRVEDLDLERTAEAPWGAIVWPQDTDKMRKRWRCPISADVREAIESALRKREVIGPGWLFPSPGNPDRPVRYEEASTWLRAAEKLAGLEPQRRTLWHAYRRLWASARKDLPDVDVAQAGGWSSLESLKQAYQQPDDATMLRVVTHATELREVR